MPVVPLLKKRNYFISSAGYVFKTELQKEIRCDVYKTKRSKEIKVIIDGVHYNLLYLMIQHFIKEIKPVDTFKFTVDKDLCIPANSIIVKTSTGINSMMSAEDQANMIRFKCVHKANSANSRSLQIISGITVYRTLLMHNYKCVYCGIDLTPAIWHLDHFHSLSKGGENKLENLVPSCSTCNIMKGALDGFQFHKMCTTISNNFLFKK